MGYGDVIWDTTSTKMAANMAEDEGQCHNPQGRRSAAVHKSLFLYKVFKDSDSRSIYDPFVWNVFNLVQINRLTNTPVMGQNMEKQPFISISNYTSCKMMSLNSCTWASQSLFWDIVEQAHKNGCSHSLQADKKTIWFDNTRGLPSAPQIRCTTGFCVQYHQLFYGSESCTLRPTWQKNELPYEDHLRHLLERQDINYCSARLRG